MTVLRNHLLFITGCCAVWSSFQDTGPGYVNKS
ncbi:hypothetical protein GLYMA_02G270450v4 [Glycine max]|nr:hypothetical protein GLYMA_02G270450v4 [Glycine max]KAH1062308.1 hypothetical protein GYH30_005348 [Glycine max]